MDVKAIIGYICWAGALSLFIWSFINRRRRSRNVGIKKGAKGYFG